MRSEDISVKPSMLSKRLKTYRRMDTPQMRPVKKYHAMYDADQTPLLNAEGIYVVKHSTVESAFGSHFAKTGEIDPKFPIDFPFFLKYSII